MFAFQRSARGEHLDERALKAEEEANVLLVVDPTKTVTMAVSATQAVGVFLLSIIFASLEPSEVTADGATILRYLACVLGLVTTLRLVWVQVRTEGLDTLRRTLFLRLIVAFAETGLITLFPHRYDTVCLIGAASVALSTINTVIVLRAMVQVKSAMEPEFEYTKFVSGLFDESVERAVGVVWEGYTTRRRVAMSFARQKGLGEGVATAHVERSLGSVLPISEMSTQEMADLEPKHPENHHEAYYAWQRLYGIRRALYHRLGSGATRAQYVGALALLVLTATVAYQSFAMFGRQPAVLTDHSNTAYNGDAASLRSWFPRRSHNNKSVHLLLVDGFDATSLSLGHTALGDVLADAATFPHTMRYGCRAALPTFTAANWLTLLTGASPDLHGVHKTPDVTQPTEFDSLFSIADAYGVDYAVAADTQWHSMFADSMTNLHNDATIGARYHSALVETPATVNGTFPEGSADDRRMAATFHAMAARDASTTNEYELIVTHLTGADVAAHRDGEGGVGARHAQQLVATAVKRVLDLTGNDTVVVVTSSHGSQRHGGHGGASSSVRDIPVVFYTKNGTNLQNTSIPSSFLTHDFTGYASCTSQDVVGTITALLGLPSPRQSEGYFFEDVVEALVPADAATAHYRDLFEAKRSLLYQYGEALFATWGRGSDSYPFDTDLIRTIDLNRNVDNTTKKQLYADGVKLLMERYAKIREYRFVFELYRNLGCSFYIAVLALVLAVETANHSGAGFPRFLTRSSAPQKKINLYACVAALATILLSLLVTGGAIVLRYVLVEGFDRWDIGIVSSRLGLSTFLTHTIAIPIGAFFVFSRMYLARFMRFGYDLPLDEAPPFRVRLASVCHDVYRVLVSGRLHYSARMCPRACLYIVYLRMWFTVLTILALLAAFPYTGPFPLLHQSTVSGTSELVWGLRFFLFTAHVVLLAMVAGALGLITTPLPNPDAAKDYDKWTMVVKQIVMLPDFYLLTAASEDATEGSQRHAHGHNRAQRVLECVTLCSDDRFQVPIAYASDLQYYQLTLEEVLAKAGANHMHSGVAVDDAHSPMHVGPDDGMARPRRALDVDPEFSDDELSGSTLQPDATEAIFTEDFGPMM